jgi:hypothetical protein
LKKKKEAKSQSSTSGEEQDESHETTSEPSKQQENIFTERQKYARRSSSSESEVPTSPGLALSHEMRKNQLFKSQERLDQKRSPPPVLPKPKPRPKPKLPPTNKNGLSSSSANRSPASPASQPINSKAMHEIANEISQIKLHNNKKKKVGKSNSSDSDSTDGNVFTKQEVKPPPIPRKPLQHAKSVDFSELQLTQNTKSGKAIQNSKSVEDNSASMKGDKKNSLPRQNAIYFEETDGYSKMDSSPEPRREEMSSTPREILHNLKERGTNLMMNKKRVLQNMCWPLGCQNGDDNGQDDEDPLYSTVNFATLGYNNSTNVDTYRDTAEVNVPICTTKAYVNPTYSPPCTSPIPSSSPTKTHLSNVVQISPELGIKEVQSLVNGAASYTVGDNGDLYSLPIKGRIPSDDTEPGKSTPEMNSPTKHNPIVLTPDDLYSQPMLDSPRRNSDSNSAGESEGPYAQTLLFQQTQRRSKSEYDIPGLLIDTTPTTFDLKPPNFKPPPPPPGGSPILRKKNNNKPSPPVLRNKNKVRSPKKMPLRDAESSPKGKNFAFQMKRSQSESDLTSEPIFATPSSIGIPREDNNNNNRHSMFVTPKEVGKLREYFIYADEGFENENIVQSGKLRNQIGNGRKQIGNHRENTFPEIVPPPPSSTPIIDTDSLGVLPPPPMYPPPRLHHSEKSSVDDNTQSESQWQEMIDSLPPPPPDMLES